jgi:hypothetical protein
MHLCTCVCFKAFAASKCFEAEARTKIHGAASCCNGKLLNSRFLLLLLLLLLLPD